MARGRMISKSLSTSRKFAAAGRSSSGEFAQLLYLMLVPHCDDFGRQEGDPFTVKHKVLPTSERSEIEFGGALSVLRDVGLIKWYESNASQIIEIIRFDDHQGGLHKRTSSRFPDIPGSSGNSSESPGNSGKVPDIPKSTGTTELNRTEEKRTEPKRERTHAHAGGAGAGTHPRDFMDCGFIGSRFKVPTKDYTEMVRRYGDAGDAAVTTFLAHLNDSIPVTKSAGDLRWIWDHFNAHLIKLGRVDPAPAPPPRRRGLTTRELLGVN